MLFNPFNDQYKTLRPNVVYLVYANRYCHEFLFIKKNIYFCTLSFQIFIFNIFCKEKSIEVYIISSLDAFVLTFSNAHKFKMRTPRTKNYFFIAKNKIIFF